MYNIFVVCMLVMVNVPLMAQQQIYKEQINITSVELRRQDDMLQVRMQIDMANLHVDRDRALTLTPVLSEGEHRVELPFILVNGTMKHKAYVRAMAIDKEETGLELPYGTLRAGRDTKTELDYSLAIPYESWMREADLSIVEDLCGCGGHVQEIDEELLVLPPEYVMVPVISFVQPEAELVKTRNEQREVYLDFPVGKTEILPDYMNNRVQLSKIATFLDEIHSDKNLQVTGVDITGYASPEGSVVHNEWLACERAKALKEYLAKRISFPSDVYHVQSGEENWDGLFELVEMSTLKDRRDVMAIIEDIDDVNLRKNKLKGLDHGEVYRKMLTCFYPKLRKVQCLVSYNVRNLSVEEGKELLETNPQYLSLDEMFRIANSYPKGSEEFRKVFEIAVRTYPDDPTANLNAAAIALTRKDTLQARKYLDKARQDVPEYVNNLGVYYMLTGELNKAKSVLTEVSRQGNREAQDNLIEIEKKLKNSR